MRTLAKILLSLCLALGTLELLARLFFQTYQDYDVEMWKYSTQLKVPVSDARGHIHKSGQSTNLMGQEVRTNTNGLRSEEPREAYPKILVLGDSFTFGWGVAQDETFVSLLERKLKNEFPQIQLINAGIGNYNTEQEIALGKALLSLVKPDLVIYAFYWNDAEPVQKEYSGIARYSLLYFLLRKSLKRLHYQAQANPYGAYYSQFYEGEQWNQWQAQIKNMPTKPPIAFLLLPELREKEIPEVNALYEKVANTLAKNKIPYNNLQKSFFQHWAKEKPIDYWVAFDDPHANAKAHALYADAFAPFVREQIQHLIQAKRGMKKP